MRFWVSAASLLLLLSLVSLLSASRARDVVCDHSPADMAFAAASRSRHSTLQRFIRLSDQVRQALDEHRPVVALESTIIAHGMPYPMNVRTAKEVEAIVRAHGATPATIAILDGVIHVGLTDSEMEQLAHHSAEHPVAKASRRDIAPIVARKGNGATTVSATMLIAHLVGIGVFVTGGIGGVHRGAEHSMDISADLTELGRTPVAVVCAGAKSILDIGLTLEYLETQGVTVIGFDTDEFPAFLTRSSGHAAPLRINTAAEVARVLHANRALKLESGIVVACPIPESEAAAGERVETATSEALRLADEHHVHGKDITPFLLAKINELTGGESLQANIALVKNNAVIGSTIAVELARLEREQQEEQGQ